MINKFLHSTRPHIIITRKLVQYTNTLTIYSIAYARIIHIALHYLSQSI